MNIPEFDEIVEPNDQTEARIAHLEALRGIVGNVYPNKFERSKRTGETDTITRVAAFAREIKDKYIPQLSEGEKPADDRRDAANAELNQSIVRVAGRLAVPPRVMGKAAFVHLSDGIERLQIYVRKQDAKAIDNDTGKIIDDEGAAWELFNLLDHGDFVGVSGYLFVTKTGELSVHVETIQFLAKAMLPMPDKMHGISDPELQRRYRYADLIASSLRIKTEEEIEEEDWLIKQLTTREVFERRARLISGMRRFLDNADYIEVETPMLTPKATGAAATPFETYHNALDIPLYARIAPELYLKRLTVGGFEKVYELNRNFRNEGLSHKHNPEFTMLEFYCAYMDVNGMMDFAEAMLKESVYKATGGSLQVKYELGDNNRFSSHKGLIEIDFSNFKRFTMKEAVLKAISFLEILTEERIDEWMYKNGNSKVAYEFLHWFDDEFYFQTTLEDNYEIVTKIPSSEEKNTLVKNKWNVINNKHSNLQLEFDEITKNIIAIFDYFVESHLIQPTFITDYPKSISPLSKASPGNPNVAERFELFINGMECANGFSELNDPREQYERFRDQMNERETGDEEAMVLDEDYIRALSYGMPPAAGIGIGIDRLVMILTNKHSIRDVILFPHLRPEKRDAEIERQGDEETKGEV